MAKRDTTIPKNVVRSHLRVYMRNRIYKLQNEVKKGIGEVIDTTLDPILATMFNEYAEMERYANGFVDRANEYLSKQIGTVNYEVREAVSYTTRQYCGIRGDKRRGLKAAATEIIANPERGVFVNDKQELVDAVYALQKTLRPFYEKLEHLEELGKEIQNVIYAARSGKDAFIQLRKLDVDMTDYRRDETLPAVVKLPNVCLINETC